MNDNEITIDTESFSIDTSSIASSNYMFSSPANRIYSITAGSSGATGSMGAPWVTNSTAWPSSITTNSTGLHVTSDAVFDGDIKWKGRSLGDMLTTIEKRLAILTPDPAKLEHFEALQKAYQHYKTLEALCEIPKQENKE